MKHLSLVRLATAVVACELIGGSGAFFTAAAIPTWYATLARPAFAPPNWIFGPVWSTLFLLMGVAAWLVWERGWQRREVRVALGMFAAQFALNILWSALFFGLHNPGAAFAEIVVLWCAIVAAIVTFGRVSRPAVWLLAPYLAWVTFAAYLNLMLWLLN